MSNLEYEPLEKAVSQFEKGIERVQKTSVDELDELLRDGAIQRFEYTMDLAWKFLQRYLKSELQVDDSTIRSKKDLFRESARLQLIDDAERWMAHYEARNATSHDYDPEKAAAVLAQAVKFLPDVKKLLETLRSAD